MLTCAGVYSREQWQHVTSLLPAVRTSAARSSSSSKSPILLDETDDADTTDDRDPLARRLEFPTPALTNARSNLLPPMLEEEADEGGMASAIEINSSSSPSIHGDAEPLEVVADYDDDVIEYDEPTDLDHATPSPAAGVRGEQEFLYLDPSAIHVADAQPDSPIAEKTILEIHDLSPEKAADTSSLIEQENGDDEAIEDANAHILKQLIGVLNDVPPIVGDSRGVVLSAHDNDNDDEGDDDTPNVTANHSSIAEPQAADSSRTVIEITDDADETEIDADEPVVVVHAQPNEFGSPQARPASAVASAESACRSPASESDVGSSSFLSCVEDEDISIDLSGQDDDEDNSERGAPARATPNSSALEATEKSGAVVVDVDDQPADNDGDVTDADVSGVDHDTAADDADTILDGVIKDAAFESGDVADTDTETDCDSDEHEQEADDSIFFDDDQDAAHTDCQASRHEVATAAPLVVPTIAVAAPADSDTDTDTDVESDGERSPDVFVTPATSLRSTKRRIIVSPEPSPVDSFPTQQQSHAVMATPLVSACAPAVASSVRTRRRIIVTPESSPEVASPAAGSFSSEPLSPEAAQVPPVQPELEDISTIDEIQVAPIQPELEDISTIDEIQVAPVQPELEDISTIDEIQVAPVQPELEVAKVQVPPSQPPAVEPAPARASFRQRVPSLAGAKPADTDFQYISSNDQSLPPIVAPSAARESVGAASIRAAAKRRLLSRRQMTTFVDEGPSTPSSRATPTAPARKAPGSLAPSKRQLATPAAAQPTKPRALPKLSATPSVSDLLSSDSSDDDNDTEADTATITSENAEPEMMLLPIGARKPQPVGTVRSAMPSKLVPFYNLLLDKNPELSAKYSNIRTFAREREPLTRSLYSIFNHAVFNDLLPEDMELQLYVPHLSWPKLPQRLTQAQSLCSTTRLKTTAGTTTLRTAAGARGKPSRTAFITLNAKLLDAFGTASSPSFSRITHANPLLISD